MATERAYLERVSLKAQALHSAGVWPHNIPAVRSTPWLNNFEESEKSIAAALLDVFIYFPPEHVNQMFSRALRRLLQEFADKASTLEERRQNIQDRIAETVFAPVQGEKPNPSDSGYGFCRLVRQLLEIDDDHVAAPSDALEAYRTKGKTVVFVDDLVGTGNQMTTTWNREYNGESFKRAYASVGRPCYYVCLASTDTGKTELRKNAVGLQLIAAHMLGPADAYRAALARIPDHPDPVNLARQVDTVLRKYGPTLDVENHMTANDYRLYGFGEIGLTLGFAHGVPDSTLPIYFAAGRDGWAALRKRT